MMMMKMKMMLPACLSARPVELPVILRTHGHPASLLHVGHDHRLVHVCAVGHLRGHLDILYNNSSSRQVQFSCKCSVDWSMVTREMFDQ